MSLHQRKVDPNGGAVEVELLVGFRHVFSYRCVLMKRDGSDPLQVLRGDTIDTLPDHVILPQSAARLSGLFLALDGFLSPIQLTGANQDFSIEIHVRQDRLPVGEGPVLISGKFQSTIPVLEHVEL
jgi:hypothetical protein